MTDTPLHRAARALMKSQSGVDDFDALDDEMQAGLLDDVRAVLSSQWQPIATAPKDGTRIVGWVGRPILVRWVERFAEVYGDTTPGWYDAEIDSRAYPTEWHILAEHP